MSAIGQICAAIGAWATRPLARLNLAFEARAARTPLDELGLACKARGHNLLRVVGLLIKFTASRPITREDVDDLVTLGLVVHADGVPTLTPFGRRVRAEFLEFAR